MTAAHVSGNTIKVHSMTTPGTGAEWANGTQKARISTNRQKDET